MSDVEKRNAEAVRLTLQEQNKKLDEMQEKISTMAMQVRGLLEQHAQFRSTVMQQIAASFDGGPTERASDDRN